MIIIIGLRKDVINVDGSKEKDGDVCFTLLHTFLYICDLYIIGAVCLSVTFLLISLYVCNTELYDLYIMPKLEQAGAHAPAAAGRAL